MDETKTVNEVGAPTAAAYRIVIEDVRKDYDGELTDDEAVQFAVDHVDLEELDQYSPQGWAYRVVLELEGQLSQIEEEA